MNSWEQVRPPELVGREPLAMGEVAGRPNRTKVLGSGTRLRDGALGGGLSSPSRWLPLGWRKMRSSFIVRGRPARGDAWGCFCRARSPARRMAVDSSDVFRRLGTAVSVTERSPLCPPRGRRTRSERGEDLRAVEVSARSGSGSAERVITGAGTSWSIASWTVQRPSPESSTKPLRCWRSWPLALNARAASSSNHERTTEPCIQRSEIPARSSSYDEACMISKPSAYACIRPYSMPLWTIFT